jgi:hypothetical protein
VNLKKLFVSQKLLIELLNVLQEILAKGGMEQKHSLKILLLRKKNIKGKVENLIKQIFFNLIFFFVVCDVN